MHPDPWNEGPAGQELPPETSDGPEIAAQNEDFALPETAPGSPDSDPDTYFTAVDALGPENRQPALDFAAMSPVPLDSLPRLRAIGDPEPSGESAPNSLEQLAGRSKKGLIPFVADPTGPTPPGDADRVAYAHSGEDAPQVPIARIVVEASDARQQFFAAIRDATANQRKLIEEAARDEVNHAFFIYNANRKAMFSGW